MPIAWRRMHGQNLKYPISRRELAKEVVDLLTNAADGAKSLIDATDRLVLYVEIACLYARLGYERKAAFFSRQVAQLYLQQENRYAAISAISLVRGRIGIDLTHDGVHEGSNGSTALV